MIEEEAGRTGSEEGGARPPLPVEVVAVVGLGLMGGSLARALKTLEPAPRVLGLTLDRDDAEDAERVGAVDAVLSGPDGLREAELVVYATPLVALLDLLTGHAPSLESAVVTDVASLKSPVLEAARSQGLEDRLVGGHPMTGGEGAGFGASRPALFGGAKVFLTSDTGSEEARRVVETFWRALGAHPTWMEAAVHDRRMVWASHLPQLAANALGRALADRDVHPEELGPGGRDMTRLAASSPAMWSDLFAHAAEQDAEALRSLAGEMQALASALEEGRFRAVEELMEETRRWRRGEWNG